MQIYTNTTQQHSLLLMILLVISIALGACQKQPPAEGQLAVTQTEPEVTETPIRMTTSPAPPVLVFINGSPYSFRHSPQVITDSLWLPAQETLLLLDRLNITLTSDYLSTEGLTLDQRRTNCHFWIGRTGENAYSSDTENEVWFSSDMAAFRQDGEIYLSENMLEDCMGEFIQFDSKAKTAALTIENLIISPLQADNPNPTMFIQLKDPQELQDSRIGVLVSGVAKDPAATWYEWSKRLKMDGFTDARITLNASDGPAATDDIAFIEKEIPNEYIEIYNQLKDLGIDTRYSLSFWDYEYRQSGGTISFQRLSNEGEVERYLDYVRMVVTSLKGVVSAYELWNEPDANTDWYQRIEPEDFISVARMAIPIIREIDPDAKIVLVSTSSYADLPCREYSHIILDSDIVALADAISLHTVNNDASPVYKSDYYFGYDQMWQDIKTLAESHGFSGEYFADELNYRSEYSLSVLQPEPGEYHPYKPEIAAKYFARMIAINLGQDITVGTSGTDTNGRPIEAKMIRNMAYLMEGLQATPFPVTVNSTAGLTRFYTFTDDGGDQFIVLWNDMEAKVESEDIEVSLKVDNISAKSVTAINPYLMNEQKLVFENTVDGVLMNRILMKDYPVIYKIERQ